MKKTNKDLVINLSNEELDKVDLSQYDKYLSWKQRAVGHYDFYGKSGKEHYKMLAYFSTLFNDKVLLDVGTFLGGSALALGFNKSNKVVSIDVKYQVEIEVNEPNIEFLEGDIMNSKDGKELIHSASFILYDTVHLGNLEREFHQYLESSNWVGICIWDDIKYRHTGSVRQEMQDFWNTIPDDRKYDISKYAHFTGTGLVWYGDKPKVNLV